MSMWMELLPSLGLVAALWYGARRGSASFDANQALDPRAFKRRDVADFPVLGAGKISGRVRPHDHHRLRSPASGEACAAYQVRVVLGQSGPGPASWVEQGDLASDERAVSFLVEDSSGCALVRPESAELQLHERLVVELSTDAPRPPLLERLLEEAGPLPTGLRLRCYEALLPFDSMVAVIGRGEADTSTPTGEGGYRTAMSRLAVGPLDDGRMLVSNLSFNPPE